MATIGRFVSFIEFKELSRVLRDNPNQNNDMCFNGVRHLANLSVFSAKPIGSQLSSLLPVVYGHFC